LEITFLSTQGRMKLKTQGAPEPSLSLSKGLPP